MNRNSERSFLQVYVSMPELMRFFITAAVVITILSFAPPASGTVLLTDAELARVKENITKEPLKEYFQNLSRGDGGRAAPILYLLNGEERYAVKARSEVQNNLANLRRYLPYKTNIWMLHGPGWLESAVLAYDMTGKSGLYTDDELREMKETLRWVISHYLNEGTDHLGKWFKYQTDYIPEDTENWVTANMNVHRLVAVGLYALVFPEEPRSKEIVRYAVDYFERILSLGSRSGGAWSENPRYAGGVLQRLYILAVALRNAGDRDFFEDGRFKKMLGFFAESIPAPRIEDPNRPTMLAAADSHWWENRTAILGWAASRYFETDPEMAGQWIWCWKNTDSPFVPESLLFVNPDVEPVKPDYKSYLPGMGYVVLRDRFAEPDETFFFTTFGPELGTSNRAMHHHPNHGDFSLIWRGHPLMLTRGCASYVWSRRMRDQTDFAHSVVTYEGAGETLAIPEKLYSGPAVEVNKSFDENLISDFYPDGITNFVATPGLEYASGQVRNWDIGLPAPFNVRHFIFLKPDVFVIWDQVRSPYPLQWNLHLPAESVSRSDKRIELTSSHGVNLNIDFLQDEPLDFTLDWPIESIRTQWPLVLSCPYGKGMFIFNSLDITRQVLDANHEGARKILENLLSYPSRPERIGLIETDGQTEKLLKKLGFTYELLDYEALDGDLSGFDSIVVGHFGMLVRDRDMMDYREKLWEYVENGGVCYWAYQFAWGWKPGDTSGPGYFPKTLMVGEGTSVLWGEGIELDRPVTMGDDPLWKSPNRITMKDWDEWQVGEPDTTKLLHYHEKPNTDRARNFPVYYSDHWRVHASALRTYNINVPATRSRFGPYRWIKVHHAPSDDYLAVLRPWKSSDSSKPSSTILKGTETEAIISQGDDCWRILLGKHSGLNGNLAMFRYKKNQLKFSTTPEGKQVIDDRQYSNITPVEIALVDALAADIGGKHFTFQRPATFSYSLDESSGTLSMLEGGKVTLPWKLKKVSVSGHRIKHVNVSETTSINLPAGDYSYILSGETLEFTRNCHVGQIEVVNESGSTVSWVHIFRDLPGKGRTWFQGATDKRGRLSMRWDGEMRQEITLSKGKKSIRAKIKPGMQRIVFK